MGFDKDSENAKFGFLCQEITIDFLQREYGWEYVSGDRNGKIQNETGFKRAIKNFLKIRTNERGQQIIFTDSDGWENSVLMPDCLFCYDDWNDEYRMIEVKGRRREDDKGLYEKKVKIDEYLVAKNTLNIPTWLIFCVEFDGTFDLYCCEIEKAISLAVVEKRYYIVDGEDYDGLPGRFKKHYSVYLWKTPKGFEKLNKFPIVPNL